MGHYSKNLGPLADEVVTECEFVSLDQKRRVKAVRTMWDTGSNATILSTALVSELRPDLFGQGGMKGIGSTYRGAHHGPILITGGTVKATGGWSAAGIGGGEGSTGGEITINGGIVRAFAHNEAGQSDCSKGAAIGSGMDGGAGTVTVKDGLQHTVGTCTYCNVAAGTDENHRFGTYGECPACHLIGLKDNGDNTDAITHWNGQAKSVTLSGRTLYKDGAWNTLCLPFDVSASQIANNADLNGCTIMELDTDGWYDDSGTATMPDASAAGLHQTGLATDGTIYLYFKDATEIEAHKPYIVKWATTGSNMVNPVFNDSEIEVSNPESIESTDGKVSFIGIYDPAGLTVNDKSNLFLGVDNTNQSTLYYPSAANNDDGNYYVNAFRAYFHVGQSIGADVRAFSLHFGDDSEVLTGIKNVQCSMIRSAEGHLLHTGRKNIEEGCVYTSWQETRHQVGAGSGSSAMSKQIQINLQSCKRKHF